MNAKTFAALAGAMRKDAAVGQKTVSGLLNWNGGAHSTMIVRNFVIPADEPAASRDPATVQSVRGVTFR